MYEMKRSRYGWLCSEWVACALKLLRQVKPCMFRKLMNLFIVIAVVMTMSSEVSAATTKKVNIKITSTQKSVVVGETLQLTATTSPKAAVTYQSDNTLVATVTKQGLVKGIKSR